MASDLHLPDADWGDVLELRPRRLTEAQRHKLEGYAAEILTTLGLDLQDPATADTPTRFIQALVDATEGYEGDPKLLKVFETECPGGADCRNSQLIEGPIRFYSLCEHHALPIYGHVYVGYIAHAHLIGLSKLTRLVRLFAKRFTLQERLGWQIADTLNTTLEPHGVAVYLEGHHLCTRMRGVREVDTATRTTYWRGAYDRDAALRAEFLAACGLRR